MARVWHQLMTQTLGYPRYGAFGGDIGGGVTQWLGALYPGPVAGVHLTSAPMADEFPDQPPTPDEQAYLDALHAYDLTDQGYSEIMWTRPDTIAAALADSPAGLAAWIVDKYRDWSDCGGDVTRRWDRDTLLTVLTLYWATGCIGSSFRSYYNYAQNPPLPQIVVPTAVTLSNEPALGRLPAQPGRAPLRGPAALEHAGARRALHGPRGARAGGTGAARVLPAAARLTVRRCARAAPGRAPDRVPGRPGRECRHADLGSHQIAPQRAVLLRPPDPGGGPGPDPRGGPPVPVLAELAAVGLHPRHRP